MAEHNSQKGTSHHLEIWLKHQYGPKHATQSWQELATIHKMENDQA